MSVVRFKSADIGIFSARDIRLMRKAYRSVLADLGSCNRDCQTEVAISIIDMYERGSGSMTMMVVDAVDLARLRAPYPEAGRPRQPALAPA